MNERDRNKIGVGLIAACAIGLLLYGTKAKAADVEVIGPSWHSIHETKAGRVFNNSTEGLGLRFDLPVRDLSVTFGGYRNSYGHPSYFTEFDYTPIHVSKVSLGLGVGAATGYQYYDLGGKLKPIIGIVVDWQISQNVGIVGRLLPLENATSISESNRFGVVANVAFTVRFGG